MEGSSILSGCAWVHLCVTSVCACLGRDSEAFQDEMPSLFTDAAIRTALSDPACVRFGTWLPKC